MGNGTLFLSRADADKALAARVGRTLEEAGYTVILQQWDFGNRSFVDAMDAALRSDARVVALLSPDYLASDYCAAEWQSAIAADPLNRKGRLVVLRVAECAPVGLLAGLAYWDLVPLRDDPAGLAKVVVQAVAPTDRGIAQSDGSPYRKAPPRLPTGTLTFLFSEIERGVEHWELHREAMEVATRRSSVVINAAIDAHRGQVFRASGDVRAAVFEHPQDALLAAIDAQRLLVAEDFASAGDILVRMAIHTGAANVANDDYIGPVVNRAARLLALGNGGQVLISAISAGLLAEGMPDAVSLVDLGEHRLKGLGQRERVYQAVAPGLPAEFAPLQASEDVPNNLPAQTTSFVGRADDVAAAMAFVQRHRVLTILGPGGIGKTRLALYVAAASLKERPDGVWFVALAPLNEGEAIPRAIASAMGVTLPSGGDPCEALLAAIGHKRVRLVLDNCEHLVEPLAALVAPLLRECPNASVLASSRQPLGISSEAILRLKPLGLPPAEDGSIGAERSLEYDAVALFCARASAADTRFSLTDQIAPAIASVCRRLDGIPLAIELAAARLRLLGARGLLERLDDRFRLLTAGGRDVDARQRTLQATIDWSYDLLSERERSLFQRCGIFVESFSNEAATFVAGADEVDDLETFDILSSLEDKSLIVADADAEPVRFRLLESMRAYALVRLAGEGERERIAQRHLEYFRELAARAEAEFMRSGNDSEYTASLASAVDDIRAALAWSLSGGEVASGAALVSALSRPWARLGLTAEGIARVEAFIKAVPESEPRLLARLWTELAWLAGDALRGSRAYEAGKQAVIWARKSGDAATLAWTLPYFALVAARLQHFEEAREALAEARSLAGPDAPTGQRLTELEVRAFVAQLSGDVDSAAAAFEQQLTLLRSIDDRYGISNAITSLAENEHLRGNTARAIELVRSALRADSTQPGIEQHAGKLANLAGYLLANGEQAEAKTVAQEAVRLLVDRDAASAWVTIALEHYALGLAIEGATEAATRLEGYCEAAFTAIGFAREPTEQITHRRLMEILRRCSGEADLANLMAEGAALQPGQAIELMR